MSLFEILGYYNYWVFAAVNGKAEDQAGNSKPKEAKTGEGEKHSKHVMISAPGGWYNTLFL